MARKLQKLHYSSLITNAQLNREKAMAAFAAGKTVEETAARWPAVFKVVIEGGVAKLGQRYDAEQADGRLETRFTIAQENLDAWLKGDPQ